MWVPMDILRTNPHWRFARKIFFVDLLTILGAENDVFSKKNFLRAHISLPGARSGSHVDVDIARHFVRSL